MDTLIDLLREASNIGIDIGELLIFGVIVAMYLKLREFGRALIDLKEDFNEHESDCRQNRRDMHKVQGEMNARLARMEGATEK